MLNVFHIFSTNQTTENIFRKTFLKGDSQNTGKSVNFPGKYFQLKTFYIDTNGRSECGFRSVFILH